MGRGLQFNLLPFLAALFLIVPVIFLIVGAASSEKGWMSGETTFLTLTWDSTYGWKGACSKLHGEKGDSTCTTFQQIKDGDSPAYRGWMTKDQLNDMITGGECVIAGSIVGLFLVIIAVVLGFIAAIGAFGRYRIVTPIAALFILLALIIVTVMWVVYISKTKSFRDQVSDADASVKFAYAFGLEVAASAILIISLILMLVSVRFPVTLYGERGYQSLS
eukprot:TRINITY_DN24_c0_g1_i1.p1 TRINITY_DN24_c0_g1~~TRINITY_DN24_c0_g1_i1.p1  ORF type:complete len:235 (+),score=21.16 TRINITY_DN24_c0_g1_i1:50-706(+)